MPKLLKSKSLKKSHEEATKELEYIELPLHDTPNSNFVSETYEEWLEEMEYEESLLTPEQKEEAKKREQKFWKLMKQLHPDKFKEVNL
jgi:hypothetical protein